METTHLLVDLPNLNASIRQQMPADWTGPACDFKRLASFVVERAADPAGGRATVFMNYREVGARQIETIERLRTLGFGVFAKPKRASSDVDDDIVRAVSSLDAEAREVMLLTHDRGLLQRCLEAARQKGAAVTVLGLGELSNWARTDGRVRFIDLAEIDGLLPAGIERHDLRRLPSSGLLLGPLQPLPKRSAGRTTPSAPARPVSAGAA